MLAKVNSHYINNCFKYMIRIFVKLELKKYPQNDLLYITYRNILK